ncbi:CHASE2 domain-containing protein [Candidatus Wolfebacteria bacterium]|nr:CHASE2 domain-containing protein [Candidatus Wolfebacteria bacterium]
MGVFLHRRHIGLALVALIAALLAGALYLSGALDTAEENILDRFVIRKDPPRDILIIAIDDRSLRAVGQWPWPRAVFADAIARLRRAEVVGIDVNFAEPSRVGAFDDNRLAEALRTFPGRVVLPLFIDPRTGNSFGPLPSLTGENVSLGAVNVSLDADGAVRLMALGRPSFAEALAGKTAVIPETARIDWRGPAETFPTISLIDVLEGTVPEDVFAHKTVLIGATAPDLKDSVETPVGLMPGVEFQANALATLESPSRFRDLPRPWGVLGIALAAFLATLLAAFIRKTLPLIVLFALGVGLIYLVAAALFGVYLVTPVLYLELAFILAAGGGVVYQYATEAREKQFIRTTFQYYLAPEVVNELVRDPSKLSLGGKRKTLSILFSDIRGFTTLSESLSPEELTERLNEYLSAMTDTILEHRGLVDKYIGDAIMAFWGAPIDDPTHAEHACRGALAMIAILDMLNKTWKKDGKPEIRIGIGISTGEVVVGNMGSAKRFNYTIVGDEVNFSSRLEGLTKAYGVPILIGENTRDAIAALPDLPTRLLDRVAVKGKSEPRALYELIARGVTPAHQTLFEHYERGRAAYERGDWDRAIAAFNEALATEPDGPSALLLERAREFKQQPPERWDGVYRFTSK